MKTRTRFIKSVIETSKQEAVQLPFTRGATRRAMITKRSGGLKALKRA